MGPLRSKWIPLAALAVAAPALAGDVAVSLEAGTGFAIENSTGAIERLRVDEATGNVSRNGALFIHTTGSNVFVGDGAGNLSAAGSGNTALGSAALQDNIDGRKNSAFGFAALANTTGSYGGVFGSYNAAFGASALSANTTGHRNAAFGSGALAATTTGSFNSAVGFNALSAITTGSRNVAIGFNAGQSVSTGTDNIFVANLGFASDNAVIRIGTEGTQLRTFVAGIRDAITPLNNAIPVLIDSLGQLGTVSSSREVKTDIRDMGDVTSRLLELRPVTFRYREQVQTLPSGAPAPPEYGLIAEEVAEIFPDLVVYDDQGKQFTVKYHELAPMLLNEMKRQRLHYEQRIAALSARLDRLETRRRP